MTDSSPARQSSAAQVAIVLLNWNSGELGAKAASSARAQDWPNTRLIVVDNASTDTSLQAIVDGGPVDTVIRHDENLGFARGMNTGFAASDAPFLLPLNCDAVLAPNYVSSLMPAMSDPRVAVVGGRVDSDAAGTTGPLTITRTMRTKPEDVSTAGPCDKVNGACPLQRRAALEQVIGQFGSGPYDPSYDTYGEDIDLACKLRRLGWSQQYRPQGRATHVRSYASAPRLADKRGRLRVNNLANRHRNIARHGTRLMQARAYVEDAAFALRQLARQDGAIISDTANAWQRVRSNREVDQMVRHR